MAIDRLDQIDGEFYLAYGHAMGAWAHLENTLGRIFGRITGMNQKLAVGVYYSARSFQGRVDMVRATVPFAKTIPAGKEFLTKTLNLATTYSQTRNRIAHDPHELRLDTRGPSPAVALRLIVSPKTGESVTVEQLQLATINFGYLSILIVQGMGRTKLLKEPELSLELLGLMPTDPVATRIDLNAANTISANIAHLPD